MKRLMLYAFLFISLASCQKPAGETRSFRTTIERHIDTTVTVFGTYAVVSYLSKQELKFGILFRSFAVRMT